MAYFDTPGLLYDSGVLYDQSEPQLKKHMAKVKLDLRSLTPDELVAAFAHSQQAVADDDAACRNEKQDGSMGCDSGMDKRDDGHGCLWSGLLWPGAKFTSVVTVPSCPTT